MNYKKTYTPRTGYTKLYQRGDCGLDMLEVGMIELNAGDSVTIRTEEREYAFVFLFGHADVTDGEHEWKSVGGRQSVFDGPAHTVLFGRHSTVTFTGCDHVKIAVCSAEAREDTQAQWLDADHVKVSTLGQEPWKRDIHMIVDERSNATRLTVGESFVEPANWAGFPAHKHDVDDMPRESVAEEVYYFLFDPEEGFGFQSLYTADGAIDETYRVKKDDMVAFPRGYHVTCGIPGYRTYILWMMAGQEQGLHRTNDPAYEWVIQP